MEHALYKLEKTKIVFEQDWSIDFKLYQPSFNFSKFHAMSYFFWYIRDYSSAINYNTAHSKVSNKYLLKAFYHITNKKEYKSQIWQHNIYYMNIIVMKEVIILEKVREKKILLKSIADTTALAELA